MHRENLLRNSIVLLIAGLTILATAMFQTVIPIYVFLFVAAVLYLREKHNLPVWSLAFLGLTFSIHLIYIYSDLDSKIWLFSDSTMYMQALDQFRISSWSFSNATEILGSRHVLFLYWLRVNYIFTEKDALILSNLFITITSLLLFYVIAKEMFNRRVASATLILLGLSCNVLLFTSYLLKDGLVLFLMALGVYLIKVRKSYFFSAIVIILLTATRIYAGMSLILVLIYEVLTSENSKLTKLLTVLLTVPLLVLTGFDQYLDSSFRFISEQLNFSSISSVFLAMFKFMFAPLPWNVPEEQYFITIIDSTFFLVFSPFILKFIVNVSRNKELRNKVIPLLIPVIVHAVALGVQYGGDSTRQRIGIIAFLFMFISIGMFYKIPQGVKKYEKNNRRNTASIVHNPIPDERG